MKVARLHGIADIRIHDEPEPAAAPGLSLVRVAAVGLCGSDLHWYTEAGIGDARLAAPLVVGHEFAGVVDGGPLDGQLVAVDPSIPCEVCELCRAGHRNLCPTVVFAGHGHTDGGLQQVIAWPTALLHPLPAGLPAADGALLEPLGVALHALDLGHLALGMRVAVVGCGPIGLCLIQLARIAGVASVVAVEPLAHRRAAARRLGADRVLDPGSRSAAEAGVDADAEADLEAGWKAGWEADVAFEVAGTDDAVHTAMRLARPGARVVLAGIPGDDRTSFPASLARRKGLTLVLVRRMKDVYPRAIRLVEQKRVDLASLITHRYQLDAVDEAFRVAADRVGVKVVVSPLER